MKRREFLALIGGAAISWPMAAAGQSRVSHVGVLGSPPPERWQVFTEALRERGWIEGQNIVFDVRLAGDRPERFPALAAELVALRPDLIVAASGTQAARPLHALTDSIPIVFRGVYDPVAAGFIASLARPGGNMTGLNFAGTASGKFFQLLQEARPGITRIALLWTPDNQGSVGRIADAIAAAQAEAAARLGITLKLVAINAVEDVEPAFAAVVRSRADALLVGPTPILVAQRQKIIAFALEQRLPTISAVTLMTRDGLLMSQAPDETYTWRRVADYVDRILKGTKPADLPVEQPSKFEFVINLKTAKAIGLTLPQSLFARADEVIE